MSRDKTAPDAEAKSLVSPPTQIDVTDSSTPAAELGNGADQQPLSPAPPHLLGFLRKVYPDIDVASVPQWLTASRWRPVLCLRLPDDARILAVDYIPSAYIPRAVYTDAVVELLRKHSDLRVVICVGDVETDRITRAATVCKRLALSAELQGRLGLKTIVCGLGLRTICPVDLDGAPQRTSLRSEPGWFPVAILDHAERLNKLRFRTTIADFVRTVRTLGNDEARTRTLVRDTIDALLRQYPQCRAKTTSFMQLANFEALLRTTAPDRSEHVFHSFRVFLAGCCILDTFYTEIRSSHSRFGRSENISVEYAWLLTAIFHDIGRPLEGAGQFLENELADEDIIVRGAEKRWLKPHYDQARWMLASLAEHVAGRRAERSNWDFGSIRSKGRRVRRLTQEWTRIFDDRESHAVISAIKLLAEVIDKASAARQVHNRSFVVSHAAPAALAILLHDWRLWERAREWRLIPVNMRVLPLGAILIFLDTWDDYKRKPGPAAMRIDKYTVDGHRAEVAVSWARSEDYEKEKIKYDAFPAILENAFIKFDIKVSVAGLR